MKPTAIIIHCSATREDKDFTEFQIDASHKARGFRRKNCSEDMCYIGYQWYIRKDGRIIKGRDETEVGAHTPGYNAKSIGICYEGGLDRNGKGKDTRTAEQKRSMEWLISDICKRWNIAELLGHRDTSPDLNGDGVIDRWEWLKECPCFDVREEYQTFMKPIIIKPKK